MVVKLQQELTGDKIGEAYSEAIMTNFDIELYLAKMDNIDWSQWKVSRAGGLKEIDKLRLFYLSMYQARQEVNA